MTTLDPEIGDVHAQLVQHATTLKSLSLRCDAMCLTAGVQLGNAVPGIYDLSNRLAELSAMLVNEDGARPAQSLESVARDIMAIGTALSTEKDAIAALIAINTLLSQRIVGLAEHVRFLAAVVSNVKIEIAAIDEGEHRLEGFADNLKQLAAKSKATVNAFQDTHQRLIKQLQQTATAQSAFVTSHGGKFTTAATEISASLGGVSSRRTTVARIASEIGTLTQKIGAQIAQCVVALQVGDSARQRLEHAGEALSIAAEVASGTTPAGMSEGEVIDEASDHRDGIVAQICTLEAVQTIEATQEFSAEVRMVTNLIGQITDASMALHDRCRALTSAPGAESGSFLSDLESKLAVAGDLIDECGKSRKLVDDTAEQVVASVADLQGLAKNVAAMATDMMIIGTNAVVTSYRLGTKGIPLSVIAQHLRNHAVHVTDAVKLVSPALDKVRDAAQQFTSARQGQDAASMETLALRITEALGAFQAGDGAVAEVHTRLESEVVTIGGVLRQAADALHDIADLDDALSTVANLVEAIGVESNEAESDEEAMPASLDQLLRKRYTMGSERVIHDRILGTSASLSPTIVAATADASLWL